MTARYPFVSDTFGRLETMSGVRRAVTIAAAMFVLNYAASSLGYLLTLRPSGSVFLWPPSGLVLAVLVLADRRDWASLVTGALLGNIVKDAQDASVFLAVSGSTVNAVEQVVGAVILRRVSGARMHFSSPVDVGALLAVAVVTNAVTSMAGALVVAAYTSANFWRGWFSWWTGDGMGILVIAPVVLTWAHAIREPRPSSVARTAEAIGVVAAVAVVASLLFSTATAGTHGLGSYAYLVFPLLIWSGIRLGARGAATATLTLAAVTAWFARDVALMAGSAGSTGRGPAFELYTFLALGAISSLIPATILAQRAATEFSLRESEARFKQLADNINEIFFISDRATRRMLYVSPSWADIWGLPLEAAFDLTIWAKTVHPDDMTIFAAARARTGRGEQTTTQFRIVRPDGSVRRLSGRAFPVRDTNGNVYRLVGVATDVTELRASEVRVGQAQKMEAIGRLAGGVAHDFNNLLTVIFAESDLLESAAALPASLRPSVGDIRAAADSAAGLTRQLMAFSRRQIIKPTIIDVNAVVTDIARMLLRLIGENIRVDVVVARGTLGIFADQGQFETLLMNLAINARDAMPHGGTLVIQTSATTEALQPGASGPTDAIHSEAPSASDREPPLGWVTLTVRDTGVGMPADDVAHAFEPFFTTKALGHGTGLGLATCHGIVTQSGGRIVLDSKIGAGTTVRATFPRIVLANDATDRAGTETSPRGSETILLAEDETAVRKVVARVLRSRGYTVIEARNGAEALQQLETAGKSVDLLLTDVLMPGMNGRDLSERVHAAYPKIKTLFVTGYVDDVDIQNQMISHAATVLPKPFTSAELTRHVRDVLDGGAEASSATIA